jgi:L-lactate dehydrogenase complex protein LldG
MEDSGRAKQAVLARIRAANGGERALQAAAAAWGQLPRGYTVAAGRRREALPALLVERLRDYDAEVEQTSAAAVKGVLERVLAERKYPRMLVARGMPFTGLANCTEDRDFSPVELDGFDGVLTGATLAIAETGTLVLQNVPGQGRRAATLVPDFHLCVAQTASLPTTFISGPSATADIEMTRIKGVHGPRFLHVVLVG